MSCDRKCSNCKFYYLQDEGYSNYTVLETVAHCIKGKHPKFPTDTSFRWEQENHKILDFAKKCDSFKRGDPIKIDVDREFKEYGSNDYSSYCEDNEQLESLNEYLGITNETNR